MGKKSKREPQSAHARGRARGTDAFEDQPRGRPRIFSYFDRTRKSVETFPFGIGGPSLRMQARQTNPIFLLVHGFWCCVTCGMLVSFGLGGLGLMTTFAWACHALFALVTLYMHLRPDPAREALLVFWALPLLHGAHWAQLVQVLARGRSPSWLWERWGELVGESLFICQMPDVVLLLLPALAASAYAWLDSDFVALAFYDLHSQLLPEHRWLNYAFQLGSPLLLLAGWHASCNARVMTDVPNVCPLLFAGASAVANGAMLHVHAYRPMRRFLGSVRWYEDQWTVWLKPLPFQMARNAR